MEVTQISFLVTCYNEENEIINTINKLKKTISILHLDAEIIVVDDCSTDSTYHKLVKIGDIKLIRHKSNQGFGQTFQTALQLACKKFCMYIPADNDESLEDIIKIIKVCNNQYAVFPYVVINKRTFIRKLISRLYVLIINILTSNNFKYYNGINIYPTKHLQLAKINYSSFAFQAECVLSIVNNKLPYTTIGINALYQDKGSSAFTFRNIVNTSKFILNLAKKKFL